MKLYRPIFNWLLIIFISQSTSYLYGKDNSSDSHTIRIILPKVALLDIESSNTKNIILNLKSPTEAGNPIINAADDRLWLNVTSIIEAGNLTSITARIDNPINGIDLSVAAETYSGSGYGVWGFPAPPIILSMEDQVIVSGIKSGISGNGPNNGFNIKYIAQANNTNYEKIISNGNTPITVTYTLTQ